MLKGLFKEINTEEEVAWYTYVRQIMDDVNFLTYCLLKERFKEESSGNSMQISLRVHNNGERFYII